MKGDASSFFERSRICSRLEKRVEAHSKGYRQNVALLGLEGYGKTHLLTHLFNFTLNSSAGLPVYFHFLEDESFESFSERWIKTLLEGFWFFKFSETLNASELMDACGSFIPQTCDAIRQARKLGRHAKHTNVLKELFALTGILGTETGVPVVLLFDEFHRLEGLSTGDSFSILSKEMMVQKNTLYIVSSSTPEPARQIFQQKLALLFGNFETIELEVLGFGETVHTFKRQFPEIIFSHIQSKFIARLTDGDPRHLSILSRILREVAGRHYLGTVKDDVLLEGVASEMVQETGRFQLLFFKKMEYALRLGKGSAMFAQILVALAQGKRKIQSLASALGCKGPDVQKALTRLSEHGMILRRGSLWTLADPLFHFWLKHVYPKLNGIEFGGSTEKKILRNLEAEYFFRESGEENSLGTRLQQLFREFQNDQVEIRGRKITLPHFQSIEQQNLAGKSFQVLARGSRLSWLCRICTDFVTEEEMNSLVSELSKQRLKNTLRLVFAIGGFDQNAKLLAQSAKVQLFELRDLNELFNLYHHPKLVRLYHAAATQFPHAQDMGSLAKSVH